MSEKTVEVPVSLLETWISDLRTLLPAGTYAIEGEIKSLIPQTTQQGPTREQIAGAIRAVVLVRQNTNIIDDLTDAVFALFQNEEAS